MTVQWWNPQTNNRNVVCRIERRPITATDLQDLQGFMENCSKIMDDAFLIEHEGCPPGFIANVALPGFTWLKGLPCLTSEVTDVIISIDYHCAGWDKNLYAAAS